VKGFTDVHQLFCNELKTAYRYELKPTKTGLLFIPAAPN